MSSEEIYGQPRRIRMEEEEEIGPRQRRRPIGIRMPTVPTGEDEVVDDSEERHAGPNERLTEELIQERRAILASENLSTKDKLRLLETNRMALAVAYGTTIKVSKTENVVYGILLFGAVVLVTLALLTTFAGLPSEITLSFVGTVLGGTIATIAQKLGKI